MRNPVIATFVAALAFALAGCAADTSEPAPETTDQSQQAGVWDSRANLVLIGQEQVGIGGRAGVTVAPNYTKNMYDSDPTPRVAARSPWEVSLTKLNNASVIPHSDYLDGHEIEFAAGTEASTKGPQ